MIWLILPVFITAGQAQPLAPCGTTEAPTPWLKAYQQNPSAYYRANNDTLYVPLAIHLVGQDNGFGYMTMSKLLDAFCTLNEDFQSAAIRFYIKGDIRYISNSTYFDHNFGEGYDMMVQNNVSDALNCYVVSSPAGNCGYSSYGLGVALAKSCMNASDHTWAHELGHQLSLPHPFNGWEGYEHNYSQNAPASIGFDAVERVDGSNCQFAGDGFCDTEPDYLNFRWTCGANSRSNIIQKDPVGAEFRSDGTLIMGYSDDGCQTRFTEEQIGAMRANLLTERQFLLYNQNPPVPVASTNLSPIFPQDGQLFANDASFTLEWEPIEGARFYIVEATVLPNFAITLWRAVTTQPYVDISAENLIPNKTAYWRIRPFNGYDGCVGYSDIHSFQLGSTVAIRESSGPVEHLEVLPNPIAGGQALTLSFYTARTLPIRASLLALTGQELRRQSFNAIPGDNRLAIPTAGLPAGLYLIRLEGAGAVVYRKVVVE